MEPPPETLNTFHKLADNKSDATFLLYYNDPIGSNSQIISCASKHSILFSPPEIYDKLATNQMPISSSSSLALFPITTSASTTTHKCISIYEGPPRRTTDLK